MKHRITCAYLFEDGHLVLNYDQKLHCFNCEMVKPEHHPKCTFSHALSTSCGQGWLSPEKANALIDALEHIARWTPVSSHMRIPDAPELAMKALAAVAKGEQQ